VRNNNQYQEKEVTKKDPSNGAYVLWYWGDREIDNPKLLKDQLEEMCAKGFSGVLATLRGTRYEFINQKVLRAVAQVSQWSKRRNLHFWFQPDPRQASRSMITATGERTQNLIVTRKPEHGLSRESLNITRVLNNKFGLLFEFPRPMHSPMLQETSLHFEPIKLERAFIFQMNNNIVRKKTIRDITTACNFFNNMADGYTEVFGEISVPEDEEWWVCAFPTFNTNLFDYAGRESNDLLQGFVENLFDACTHLDGITWGEGGNGYVVNMGRFPVSLSLYNTFIAEYRYDLRDVLYALILDVDNASHIKIRCDYYSLLMDVVFGAQKDFYRMIHSFFEGLDIGLHHAWHFEKNPTENLVKGSIDPWRSLDSIGSIFSEIGESEDLDSHLESIISILVITKSLGRFSETQRAFICLKGATYEKKELMYWTNLLGLFSLNLVTHTSGDVRFHVKEMVQKSDSEHSAWKNFLEINNRIAAIKKITQFLFPEANVALIFPTETIMSIGSQDANKIIFSTNQMIRKLIMEGVQLDVISSVTMKKGKVSPKGLQINNQIYDTVLLPYPEVLDPKVLDTISLMDKIGHTVLLGGCNPGYTTLGKRIPHIFPLTFDPSSTDFTTLWDKGLKRLFSGPKNGIGTMIKQGDNLLFLLCPNQPGGTIQGDVCCGNIEFHVPESSDLVIFRKVKGGGISQIL